MKEEQTHCGPSPNRIPTTSDLKIWATELGFDALGVADIDLSKQKKSVIDWLRAGFAGEMHYMKRNIKKCRVLVLNFLVFMQEELDYMMKLCLLKTFLGNLMLKLREIKMLLE